MLRRQLLKVASVLGLLLPLPAAAYKTDTVVPTPPPPKLPKNFMHVVFEKDGHKHEYDLSHITSDGHGSLTLEIGNASDELARFIQKNMIHTATLYGSKSMPEGIKVSFASNVFKFPDLENCYITDFHFKFAPMADGTGYEIKNTKVKMISKANVFANLNIGFIKD